MASQRAKKRVGPKNSRWDNTKTIEDRLSVRDSTEYRKWRKGVYKRDKGRCKICQKNNNLHAHHLDGWISCKERRVELQNGVLLCKDCHKNFHKIYGVGDNTAEEFIEYYLLKCVKLKICV